MKEEMGKSALKMLRRFIADHSDREAGMWLVTEGRQVATFVENDLDKLTRNERLKFYGLMEGFFPKHFERVLAKRLTQETDVECLKLLQTISGMHQNQK